MSTKTIVILKGVHIDNFDKFATMLADEPNINIIVLIFSENTIFQTNKMESRHFEKWSTLIPNFALGATCIGRYVG